MKTINGFACELDDDPERITFYEGTIAPVFASSQYRVTPATLIQWEEGEKPQRVVTESEVRDMFLEMTSMTGFDAFAVRVSEITAIAAKHNITL